MTVGECQLAVTVSGGLAWTKKHQLCEAGRWTRVLSRPQGFFFSVGNYKFTYKDFHPGQYILPSAHPVTDLVHMVAKTDTAKLRGSGGAEQPGSQTAAASL